jgi:hypothetical protein
MKDLTNKERCRLRHETSEKGRLAMLTAAAGHNNACPAGIKYMHEVRDDEP